MNQINQILITGQTKFWSVLCRSLLIVHQRCVQFSGTAWAEQAGTGPTLSHLGPGWGDFRPRRVGMALKRAHEIFWAQWSWPGSGVFFRASEKIIKNFPFIICKYVGLQSCGLKWLFFLSTTFYYDLIEVLIFTGLEPMDGLLHINCWLTFELLFKPLLYVLDLYNNSVAAANEVYHKFSY